jgi:hypothetical protein
MIIVYSSTKHVMVTGSQFLSLRLTEKVVGKEGTPDWIERVNEGGLLGTDISLAYGLIARRKRTGVIIGPR